MFIIGSICSLPQLSRLKPIDSWIYIAASNLYMIVSVHDAAEVTHHYHHGGPLPIIDLAAALNYIVGALLFIIARVLFLPSIEYYVEGSWCFIFGSLCFAAGAFLNGMQIFETPTKRDAQCMLLMTMSYIVGSVMFLVPSILYLYLLVFDSISAREDIYTFSACVYIAGSVCFTVGGIINFYRSSALRDVGKTLGMKEVQESLQMNEENDEANEETGLLSS